MAPQRNKQSAATARIPGARGEAAGATTMLRADHRSVEKLFREFEAEESGERKAELARRACNELIVHTMLEEEIFYKADGGVFAQARAARLDMKVLGERLQARKAELLEQAESGPLPPPAPRSLASGGTTDQDRQEKPTMQRERERDRSGGRGSRADEQERDEYGRFMREDDRTGSWSRGRGGGYQEREQQFQGSPRSSRGRDDDDRRGSRSGR
jgi:hypothetical protein